MFRFKFLHAFIFLYFHRFFVVHKMFCKISNAVNVDALKPKRKFTLESYNLTVMCRFHL